MNIKSGLLMLIIIGGVSSVLSHAVEARGYRLTNSQMDAITAGTLTILATANAAASSLGSAPAITSTMTATKANPHVAIGRAIAIARGNETSSTSAAVIPSGGMVNRSASHTVNTPSGLSISVAIGIAVAGKP